MLYSRKNSGGFTLIELLVVICILSIVSITVYSVLNNGVNIWNKVNTALPGENQELFLYKFNRDARNTVIFRSIPFIGQLDRLEFASLVDFNGAGFKTVGKVIYAYNPFDKVLYRWESDFSQNFNGEESPAAQALTQVKSFKLQYCFYDPSKKQFIWFDSWTKQKPPSAVRMQIEFEAAAENSGITRTVSIPVAG